MTQSEKERQEQTYENAINYFLKMNNLCINAVINLGTASIHGKDIIRDMNIPQEEKDKIKKHFDEMFERHSKLNHMMVELYYDYVWRLQ